jgi:pimeloyl-ACP methyl ester carboxylesterase
MERARFGDIELDYEVRGEGEPVVFIHGAFIADAFQPLLTEPALGSGYRLISYRHQGYCGSRQSAGRVSIESQAADCAQLLAYLGVRRAHVVGHSYGGCVALQVALSFPDVAHSLVVLEPGLAVGESAEGYRASLERGAARYREAGAAVVVDEFLEARWPAYRAKLDQVLPSAFAQAVVDADVWFGQELPGLLEWQFGETEAQRIAQPVLAVLGGASDALSPRFAETQRLLMAWLRHAEGFVVPEATHFLHLESPAASRAMAGALAGFFARHPL